MWLQGVALASSVGMWLRGPGARCTRRISRVWGRGPALRALRLALHPPPRPIPPAADIDELANPLQAALVSAICFVTGAAIPLLSAAWIGDPTLRIGILAGATTGEAPAHSPVGSGKGRLPRPHAPSLRALCSWPVPVWLPGGLPGRSQCAAGRHARRAGRLDGTGHSLWNRTRSESSTRLEPNTVLAVPADGPCVELCVDASG